MTRAREKLILVGSPRKLDKALERWARPATPYAAGTAKCMLDWVMQSLGGFREGQYDGKNGSVWRMALQPAEEANAPAAAQVILPPLSLNGTEDERIPLRNGRGCGAASGHPPDAGRTTPGAGDPRGAGGPPSHTQHRNRRSRPDAGL